MGRFARGRWWAPSLGSPVAAALPPCRLGAGRGGDRPHMGTAQVPFSSGRSFPEHLILHVKKAILKNRFISQMCLF